MRDDHSYSTLEIELTLAEILIFGTGAQPLPIPKEIRDYISGLGIQLDVMDSVCLSPPALVLPLLKLTSSATLRAPTTSCSRRAVPCPRPCVR